MRTTLFSLLTLFALLVQGCASREEDGQIEHQVAQRKSVSTESSTDQAEALPDCKDVVASPNTTVVPVIQQVEGSDTLYVLVVGETAICSGEFEDVASSRPAAGGVVFNSDEWAGSNPMPGRTSGGFGGSNPMPGTPNPETDPPPGGSNPMPGNES